MKNTRVVTRKIPDLYCDDSAETSNTLSFCVILHAQKIVNNASIKNILSTTESSVYELQRAPDDGKTWIMV